MAEPWWIRLKAARVAKGWKQEAVVDAVRERFPESKLTQGTYSTLEKGKRPRASIETLLPIATVLGVQLQEHELGGEDEQPVQAEISLRAQGAALFEEDIEARTPHRLPQAREWLKGALAVEYMGSEGWGRMVWFRRLLEDWNEFRKGSTAANATPATAAPSEFEQRRLDALERKRLKDEGGA